MEQVADAGAGGRLGDLRPIVGRRVDQEDPRRPRHGPREAGRSPGARAGARARPGASRGRGAHRGARCRRGTAPGRRTARGPPRRPRAGRRRPRCPPSRTGRRRRRRRTGRPAAAPAGSAGAAWPPARRPSLPTITASASRRSWARRRWPKRAAGDRWYSSGSSHGARSRRVATTGSPGPIGSAPPAAWATTRDAPGDRAAPRPVPIAAPRTRNGSSVSAPERNSRVMGRRRLPTTGSPGNDRARIVGPEVQQEEERLAGQRGGGIRAEEAAQVGGRDRRPAGVLERAHVHQDAHRVRDGLVGRPPRRASCRARPGRVRGARPSGAGGPPPGPRRRCGGSSCSGRRAGRER